MAFDLANKKGLLVLGGIGLLALMGKKGGSTDSGNPDIIIDPKFAKPYGIDPGQEVSTHWYRVSARRREGMTYVPVAGVVGERLTFTSPAEAKMFFTWSILDEGGVLNAEFAPKG